MDRPESSNLSPPDEITARPLPFFYDLYTFRGNEDTTTIVATIAVPVGELRRERSQNQVNYRFDLRLVLADTARRSVSNTEDSVFLSVPRPLRRQHLLHTHVEVRAPPSSTTVQRLVVTAAARQCFGKRSARNYCGISFWYCVNVIWATFLVSSKIFIVFKRCERRSADVRV